MTRGRENREENGWRKDIIYTNWLVEKAVESFRQMKLVGEKLNSTSVVTILPSCNERDLLKRIRQTKMERKRKCDEKAAQGKKNDKLGN